MILTQAAQKLSLILQPTEWSNMHIRIPVPWNMRENWKSNNKIFRFWKLRTKEFSAVDTDTKS